ncbi:NfeD family protein [Paenibacillus filicis]|uniref:NfeD family protein n=1 Tax=Paenibacillus gyeongsangnamensis TaxID=3388067 RepID=A0ABT4QKA5_9BACL|nr:NfeD family protein [Paenibacillus filicis]MCZ8517306.1 NfeD family protein [Paenibacillus filicis]
MLLWIGWLLLTAVFILIELHTGTFYFLLLAVASLLTLGLALSGSSLLAQCFVFMGAAFLLYVFLMPIIRRVLPSAKDKIPQVTETILGKQAYVVKDILPGEVGQVKVDGELWSAIADETITQGEKVQIIEVRVSKLIVKKE